MSNFAQDIEAAAAGEAIEAVVIGGFGWGSFEDDEPYGSDRIERLVPVRKGVVLPWDEARPMLDYQYSTGFGAPECDALWAWTATRVLFVSQYDGATSIVSMPRNPVDGQPEMPGG